jgi:hypothetical protein
MLCHYFLCLKQFEKWAWQHVCNGLITGNVQWFDYEEAIMKKQKKHYRFRNSTSSLNLCLITYYLSH